MILQEKDELKKEWFGKQNLAMYREAKFSGLENKLIFISSLSTKQKDSQKKKWLLSKG